MSNAPSVKRQVVVGWCWCCGVAMLPLLLALLQDVLQDLLVRITAPPPALPNTPHLLVFMAKFCTCRFSVVLFCDFSAFRRTVMLKKLLHIWPGHKFPIVLVPPAYEDIQLNTKTHILFTTLANKTNTKCDVRGGSEGAENALRFFADAAVVVVC